MAPGNSTDNSPNGTMNGGAKETPVPPRQATPHKTAGNSSADKVIMWMMTANFLMLIIGFTFHSHSNLTGILSLFIAFICFIQVFYALYGFFAGTVTNSLTAFVAAVLFLLADFALWMMPAV